MYDIYHNGELLHSDLTYEESMKLLRQFSEEENYDPQKIEMLKKDS